MLQFFFQEKKMMKEGLTMLMVTKRNYCQEQQRDIWTDNLVFPWKKQLQIPS